ncbi:putative nucleic acid binding AN1-type Zn finger protein [Chryseobacterium sp. H1D6B]|uniref:bacteriocin-like protein n=1 Tax=Chryseobacterium sp. H1D6B TaxID=2940588 RepID=UPI0015CAE3B5|nr:hypothetical protein [Chryseobacterium sp. H1D6B]MDH6254364.1 putative nucleic acid binding AN1-type Zn finger protein [Chryseobacterium sp. H1D6B]
MKKVLSSKKLSRQDLKTIQGAGQTICCAVSCADPSQCGYATTLPTKCPDLPACV